MPVAIAYVLGIIAALAATIVAFVMVVPEKKRAGLNKFFQYIHDLFNFKSLWIEKIMKFLYIFETLACIAIGFFMLFSAQYGRYMGGVGILLIILGPIITRIFYEFIMMTILLVKNTIDINNKLVPQKGSVAEKKAEEEKRRAEQEAARQQYAQPQYVQPQYAQPTYQQPVYQQPPQYAQPQQPYTQPAPAPQDKPPYTP